VASDNNLKIENKAEALANKLEFEMRHGFRGQNHYQFQGGILKYHQWITLPLGALLFLTGLIFQQGAWIYFYFIGLMKIGKDTVKEILDSSENQSDLKPLMYYLYGALIISIIMYLYFLFRNQN